MPPQPADVTTTIRYVLVLLATFVATHLDAQDIVRSAMPWRTLRTQWFEMHYPLDTEAWALDLAPRLDAMHDAVANLVGYAPPGRTTIVIDDPYNVANGKAIPILGAPVVHFWVTPPGPTDQIANHRGWGIKLASHEFAHIAHLSRPARRTQWFWHLLPAQVSPLAVFTPRWALEGYATWIEGKLTGSGRPHGTWRPSLLRELALAGRLPSYGALSTGGGYKGGSLAYLAGSAFWEWLAAQRGDTSMTLVFRRQTARIGRSFDESFRGVYGDPPAVMYARFSAELTAKAFAVDTALRLSGLVPGARLARFTGFVGGPAVSADGKRIALALPGLGASPRVIVAAPDTQLVTKAEQEQLARNLRRDTADVPALRVYPRLTKPIATLTARRGRTFGNPRFADAAGTRVLVDSWSVRRDATQRPDLAIWDVKSGDVRHVTDGAAVQDADPSPDGARAAAVRCSGGVCDLVLVSLASGVVTTLAEGTPTKVFSHPRWSPDGTRLVAGVQDRDGSWRLALVDPATGAQTLVTPADDVNRHSASFDATGTQLVYVSEAGGIPNVETLTLRDGSRTARSRVLGSVYEPAPMPNGDILFLSEYAGGFDLVRVDSTMPVRSAPLGLDAIRLVPAMPRPRERGITLASAAVTTPAVYGLGPRRHRLLAHTAMARDGFVQTGSISSADPANRFTWMLSGMAGTRPAWRGGVASGVWYGSRPHLRGETFWLEQRSGDQRNALSVTAANSQVAGGSIAAELPIAGSSAAQRVSISAFAGSAKLPASDARARLLVSAQYSAGVVTGWRASAGFSTRAAVGRLGDSAFVRGSVGMYLTTHRTRLDARMYRASNGTPWFEQFSAGGFAPPVSDEASLAQRIAMPSLPVGIAQGRALYETRIARPMPWLPVTIYAQSVGTAWQLDRHSAVVGLEQGIDIDYLGLVGLPRLHALAGIARVVRGPLADKGSAYLTLGWRP
ncbi:MAG: hypothetical protein H7099_18700 [Gemmatimonadaceae bacterium]|nr:hypothetical protein [Gemmatimonadaceae bacterium]